MLEAKYYRDYRHNYMILRCGNEAVCRSYQYKILTSDKIDGILRCYVRYMNGTTYYYYDISSRTTLECLYRDRKMSCEQVKDLLWQLHGICDKLSGYFMEEAALVLLPEHIYYDLTNQKYIGLYYPDYQAQDSEIYRPLMDFMLEHIDTEDSQLTEAMYRIYEMSEEPCFTLEEAIQILEESEQPKQEPVETNAAIYDIGSVKEPQEQYNMGWPDEELEKEESNDEKPHDEDRTSRKRCLFYGICGAAAALGLAGAVVIYNIYELTQEEEIALYGVMAVMGLCLLVCLIGCLGGSRNKTVSGSGRKSGSDDFTEPEPVSLDGVLSKDMGLGMVDVQSGVQKTTEHRSVEMGGVVPSYKSENDNYGNTVFYDGKRIEECKLYAMDKSNKNHIELKRFPCTVGKMAGCVDYVLPDDSVSRIHARFDREGEKILLTDMNSTNGTYKNGLRMQPQETVEIEPGDEVRFGGLNYCYR